MVAKNSPGAGEAAYKQICEHAQNVGLSLNALFLKAGIEPDYLNRWRRRNWKPSPEIMARIMQVKG